MPKCVNPDPIDQMPTDTMRMLISTYIHTYIKHSKEPLHPSFPCFISMNGGPGEKSENKKKHQNKVLSGTSRSQTPLRPVICQPTNQSSKARPKAAAPTAYRPIRIRSDQILYRPVPFPSCAISRPLKKGGARQYRSQNPVALKAPKTKHR